jgi:beta-N-acetylhexosaminidase
LSPTCKVFLLVLLLLPGAQARARAPKHSQRSEHSESAPVRRWMRSMKLRNEAAQLVVAPFYGESLNTRSQEYRKFLHWVRDLGVGGLILVNRVQNGSVRRSEPYAVAAFVNRMQRAAKTPLLIAGDYERGASMRVELATRFPHNMAFAATRDPSFSRYEGMIAAREARALGTQWVFAPVADVNNNPDNPIINIRSYGENPEEVSAHVRAYIEGLQSGKPRVLATAKHFPGHGDTSVDTHLGLATISADRARLDRVELVPFRAAIAQGVDAVMTAHIAVPALDAPETPATLSGAILTGLLRRDLGFKGLIVTDALDMQGVAKQYGSGEAAVKALEAGADVLVMPPQPEDAIDAIVNAVATGRLTRRRIQESVSRVLAAKARVGLDRKRTANLETMGDELDSPEVIDKVQEIADRSVTLVKNNNDVVPLRAGANVAFVILTEGCCSTEGRAFQAEVRKRMPKAQISRLDPSVPDAGIDKLSASIAAADVVVVAAFASVAAYRSGGALDGNYPKLINALLATNRPVALIALGNPYLIRSFPNVSAYLATYSTVPPSEIAAVKALFGEVPIHGRLPVTIPGIANYGDGIQIDIAAK